MPSAGISVSQAYDVLGLESGADMEAVKKAYKEKALRTHPDKVPPEHRERATKEFQQLGAAYEVITKAGQRRTSVEDYDDEDSYGGGFHPHFSFHFNSRGGAFFASPFFGGGGYYDDDDDDFYDEEDEEDDEDDIARYLFFKHLFERVYGGRGYSSRSSHSAPRGGGRPHWTENETHEQYRARMAHEREEREAARARRAAEDRRYKEEQEKERAARAAAKAARRKAKAEKRKQDQNPELYAERAREAARKAQEALKTPQQVRTDVFAAARRGDADAVKKGIWERNVDASGGEVLPRAIDPVAQRPENWDPMETLTHIAVENGDVELVEWLIDHNAEPEERDASGETAFHRALRLGKKSIAEYFLENHPPTSPDSKLVLDPPGSDSIVRLAVESGDPTIVTLVFNSGLVDLADVPAAWDWIDEQAGSQNVGSKFDKVRTVLRMVDGWTPPQTPVVEAQTTFTAEPSPIVSQQTSPKDNNRGQNQRARGRGGFRGKGPKSEASRDSQNSSSSTPNTASPATKQASLPKPNGRAQPINTKAGDNKSQGSASVPSTPIDSNQQFFNGRGRGRGRGKGGNNRGRGAGQRPASVINA